MLRVFVAGAVAMRIAQHAPNSGTPSWLFLRDTRRQLCGLECGLLRGDFGKKGVRPQEQMSGRVSAALGFRV